MPRGPSLPREGGLAARSCHSPSCLGSCPGQVGHGRYFGRSYCLFGCHRLSCGMCTGALGCGMWGPGFVTGGSDPGLRPQGQAWATGAGPQGGAVCFSAQSRWQTVASPSSRSLQAGCGVGLGSGCRRRSLLKASPEDRSYCGYSPFLTLAMFARPGGRGSQAGTAFGLKSSSDVKRPCYPRPHSQLFTEWRLFFACLKKAEVLK